MGSVADHRWIHVSESIENTIRGLTGIQAKYLGEIKFKNVDYEVSSVSTNSTIRAGNSFNLPLFLLNID
jgi:hypothetical protein